AASPPAAACLITNVVTARLDPRSTCSQRLDTFEQNLSASPPATVPLTAFAGPSLDTHGGLPVAGRLRARVTAAGGALNGAGGTETTGAPDGTPAASIANSM